MTQQERIDELEAELALRKCEDVIWRLPEARDVRFTPAERVIVKTLRGSLGEFLPHDRLVDALQAQRMRSTPTNDTLKVLISRIRRKIQQTTLKIETSYCAGYRLVRREGSQ